jgi:hypothetical protein
MADRLKTVKKADGKAGSAAQTVEKHKLEPEKVPVEDLEYKIRVSLNQGLPINWELFWKIAHYGGCGHTAYKEVVDLLLHFDILSLEQDGNITLRKPDATSSDSIGNPRHYGIKDVECGNNPLFFKRDQDALEYMRTGEELNYLVKGCQAQRIHVVK